MVSLKNIIIHILQAHGFDVYERDGIVHGEKNDYSVSVGIYGNVTVNDIRTHHKSVEGQGDKHILCVLEASDAVEEEARNLGFVLWRKADLEKELGNAIVMSIGESGGSFRELVIASDRMEADAPIRIENLGTEGKPIIMKSQLTLDDVKEITNKTIHGFKFELELVPYYLFQYSCRYEGKDGRAIDKNGTISVNALTGRYAEWSHNPELDTASEHMIQLEPKIDQDNAQKIAVHAIITLNTEFKEVIVERDHATIIEKATFKPDADSIALENQAIIMVPVWCAEGKHGVMILDGITGKVISEDYYESR